MKCDEPRPQRPDPLLAPDSRLEPVLQKIQFFFSQIWNQTFFYTISCVYSIFYIHYWRYYDARWSYEAPFPAEVPWFKNYRIFSSVWTPVLHHFQPFWFLCVIPGCTHGPADLCPFMGIIWTTRTIFQLTWTLIRRKIRANLLFKNTSWIQCRLLVFS